MKLFTPIKFRNLEIKNRVVMAPMCMYSAENGVVNDFHLVHYATRAFGGVGLIIAEATGVVPEGRITDKCAGIWNDEQAEAWKKIVEFIHQNTETKIGIQLGHAGRKASTWNGKQTSLEENGWITVAPSEIPYLEGERTPHALTKSEISELVNAFKEAAVRSVKAGFDVIEIHAAHGYLISQFLSPLSNVRTDEYGGSLENRARILLEIVEAVNEVLNDNVPLFVRISATEYAENGWNVEDSVALSKILKEKGVDLIDVSSGGNISDAKINVFSGYQVPFSHQIKQEAEAKTGAVGLITNATQAEEILQKDEADVILLARELLRNPYFVAKSSWENNQVSFFPPQYERGKP